MSDKMVEMPEIEIPDEVRQDDIPEIKETTPHPKPESPLATFSTNGNAKPDDRDDRDGEEQIGFFS